MKPFERVVLSSDRNPKYLDFWPVVRRAWKKLFDVDAYLVLVDNEPMSLSAGEKVYWLPLVEGVPSANQAKVARHWFSALMADNGWSGATMVNDIDMLPLSRGHVFDLLKDRPTGTLLTTGAELYTGPEQGKFRIAFLTGEAQVFKALVNPAGLKWKDWVTGLIGLKKFDHKEDISNATPTSSPDCFSDESLLRYFLWKNPVPVLHRPMPFWPYTLGALDRFDWQFDPAKLKAGGYKEAHLLRPYKEHVAQIQPLIDYIESL
jgi:hypothetical protein